METLIIKIKNNKALKLIQELEALDLIQIVDTDIKKPTTKLSEILKGSITSEQADDMHKELEQIRNEWTLYHDIQTYL